MLITEGELSSSLELIIYTGSYLNLNEPFFQHLVNCDLLSRRIKIVIHILRISIFFENIPDENPF